MKSERLKDNVGGIDAINVVGEMIVAYLAMVGLEVSFFFGGDFDSGSSVRLCI